MKKLLDLVAGLLVLAGAVNWGLVAVAEWDLVAAVFGLEFGETSAATRIAYALIGLAAVFTVRTLLGSPRATERQRARPPLSASR